MPSLTLLKGINLMILNAIHLNNLFRTLFYFSAQRVWRKVKNGLDGGNVKRPVKGCNQRLSLKMEWPHNPCWVPFSPKSAQSRKEAQTFFIPLVNTFFREYGNVLAGSRKNDAIEVLDSDEEDLEEAGSSGVPIEVAWRVQGLARRSYSPDALL